MNKIEEAYSLLLNQRLAVGEVAAWRFEAITLRLADLTTYTPDFFVVMADGAIELHEVKACMANGKVISEDDAKVKIKVAAELYQEFTFRLAAYWRRKKLWKYESYNTTS